MLDSKKYIESIIILGDIYRLLFLYIYIYVLALQNELNQLQMDMRTMQDNFQKFEDKKRRIDERIHTEEVSFI